MGTLTENEIADIKDYADELETELNHRTLQWEGVKDMLGTAQAELAEVKAENERLREAIHGVLQADRKLGRPFPDRNNRELYQAIDALQAALAERVEGE